MTCKTTRVVREGDALRFFRQKCRLEVVEGPDRGATIVSSAEHVSVGTAPQNALVLSDSTVSRYHLRVSVTPRGYLLEDLESTNGTTLDGLALGRVGVSSHHDLRLGETTLRFSPLAEQEEIPLSSTERFGSALGRSAAMRELFRKLELAAPKDVTVLLEGETGTGKEVVAEEIHRHSTRRDRPFVVVDCAAIPASLIESELFGHVEGAFTSAGVGRLGAFESADGGTLFLDEIGELDLAIQPRLLRAIERGEVKRLGEDQHRRVDVRVIAATHRDLQRRVNQGTFRADLFYRLAVLHLRVPPLRERPEDIELLVEHMLPLIATRLGVQPQDPLSPQTLQQLLGYAWPGNVRELRNVLERLVTLSGSAVTFDALADAEPTAKATTLSPEALVALPFKEAKTQWLTHFELRYLEILLERCKGNVAEAARQSGIDRVHLFRLVKKYGLRR